MGDLTFEVIGNIGVIKLNRPDSMNAFSENMIVSWLEALEEIKYRDDITVGIVTGNGKAFCAGGDLKALINGDGFMGNPSQKGIFSDSPQHVKNNLWEYIQRIPLKMEEIDKPIIAAINGPAMGAGLDIALMCDIRFCSDKAKLGEAYINAGIVPGDGGAYYLPKIVGYDKALDLLWTGKVITAQEAKEIGLVTQVFPHENLFDETMQYAEYLAVGPKNIRRMIKRAVYESSSMTLKQSLDYVSSLMAIAVFLPDHKIALETLKKSYKK